MDYLAFMTTLNMFRFKNFSVKANRDTMATTLANLQINVPFAKETRFPDEGIYIDLNHSVTIRLMALMMKALDYSDRQTEKGREVTNEEKNRSFSNFEDAKVCFYNTLNQILNLVGPLDIERVHIVGVYVQTSFESEDGLKWT